MNSFWDKKEIIGLAPMDGVTDAAYRYIADTYGKPDLLITEFVSVEGVVAGATTLLDAFIHHKSTIPTIAQIYGTELEAFYKMTIKWFVLFQNIRYCIPLYDCRNVFNYYETTIIYIF